MGSEIIPAPAHHRGKRVGGKIIPVSTYLPSSHSLPPPSSPPSSTYPEPERRGGGSQPVDPWTRGEGREGGSQPAGPCEKEERGKAGGEWVTSQVERGRGGAAPGAEEASVQRKIS